MRCRERAEGVFWVWGAERETSETSGTGGTGERGAPRGELVWSVWSILFTQITREAPSVPRRETFIAPTLLPACCACRLVQDESAATSGLERWMSQRTYRKTHGVNPTELALTHTYCPTCFAKVQETVRQFFRKSGTPP